MTRGIKQIPAMGWVYIKENTGDYDGFFFEKFFKERLGKALYTACYPNECENQPSHCSTVEEVSLS